MWDGAAFSLYFDGSDVELTIKTQEKIDGLQVLDGSASPINGGACVAYLLVSTQGPGRVTDYTGASLKFGGEDAGLAPRVWATLLPVTGTWCWTAAPKACRATAPIASAQRRRQTLYLTTQKTFNVDMPWAALQWFMPMISARPNSAGLTSSPPITASNKKIDGLHVDGDPIPWAL